MEPIETNVRPRWQARLVLLVVAFVLFAAWFAYDGAVACPAFNERATLHNSLVVDQGRRPEWIALASEKGWPLEFKPEEVTSDGRARLRSDFEVRVQLVLAAGSFLLALGLALRVVLSRRRSVVLDDEGLLVGDERIPLERMVAVDRRRWQSQGVAVLRYTDERGARHHLRLNSWTHAGVAEILERVEAGLPDTEPES